MLLENPLRFDVKANTKSFKNKKNRCFKTAEENGIIQNSQLKPEKTEKERKEKNERKKRTQLKLQKILVQIYQ